MSELVEILEYNEAGYRPVVDFESWRVAILNHSKDYLPQNITYAQKHDFTDEVFVLLEGKCILYIYGNENNKLGKCEAVPMEKNKIYNVKKGVWHTHALLEGTKVLIVENRDTTNKNSPIIELNNEQKQEIIKVWSDNYDKQRKSQCNTEF